MVENILPGVSLTSSEYLKIIIKVRKAAKRGVAN
jgi:hypothetical protein